MWRVRVYTSVTLQYQDESGLWIRHVRHNNSWVLRYIFLLFFKRLFIAKFISENINSQSIVGTVVRSDVLCLRCTVSVVVFVFGCECVYLRVECRSISPSRKSSFTVYSLTGSKLRATVFTHSEL